MPTREPTLVVVTQGPVPGATKRYPRNDPTRPGLASSDERGATVNYIDNWGPGSIVINGATMSADEIYDTWQRKAREKANAANGVNAPISRAREPR